MDKKIKKPELLAPAGDLEKLKVAFLYGADAVFLGLQNFGLRSGASNFTLEEVEEGVLFAKQYNGKVYITTNIFAHEENYENFVQTIKKLDKIGVTGIIVSDPGYIKLAKEHTKLEIHISTQQSVLNSHAVNFYEKLGAKRVVLGRELTKEEIKEIINKVNVEIEVFVHGALCSSYSGRCTLSNHMTLRDSNRGGCCQSCRWNYELMYEEEGKINKVDKQTKFNMSSKDINLLKEIPSLVQLGIHSLKIEGRMKSLHYVATVIKVYRMAIDDYVADPENYVVEDYWIEELQKAESRKSSEGPFLGIKDRTGQIYNEQYQTKEYDYCGYVLDYDITNKEALVEQRNFFKVGDEIEIIIPGEQTLIQKVTEIINEHGEAIQKANHPLMKIKIKTDSKVKKHSIIRKRV